MRTPPTVDTLQALRLPGMAQALSEPLPRPDITARSVAARFGLLVDRELTEREARRRTTRLRQAKLRQTACCEARDSRPPRGRDNALVTSLAPCQWVRDQRPVLITGPTGGETLAGLCLGPSRVSGRLDDPLPPVAPAAPRPAPGHRRRALSEAADAARPDRTADAR